MEFSDPVLKRRYKMEITFKFSKLCVVRGANPCFFSRLFGAARPVSFRYQQVDSVFDHFLELTTAEAEFLQHNSALMLDLLRHGREGFKLKTATFSTMPSLTEVANQITMEKAK